MIKNALVVVIIVLLLGVGAFIAINKFQNGATTTTNTQGKLIRIGLSLDTLKEDRWKMDRDYMVEEAKAKGVSLDVLIANGDDNLQISQIGNFVSQKVDVLVIVPHDAIKVVPAVEKARAAGIKVISYDRLIKDTALDLYVTFDNEKVGKLQAEGVLAAVKKGNFVYIGGSPTDNNATLLKTGSMSVLEPKIKSGDIKLVYSEFTTDWKPDVAYKNLKAFIAKGGKVDAVVAANDGTAFGSIKALDEVDLAGKVPVSGQDAELSALKRLIEGTQTVTVYKPLKQLAIKTIDEAIKLASGKKPDVNASLENGKFKAPSYFITPILVTKNNIQETVIKDGFYTYDQVYK